MNGPMRLCSSPNGPSLPEEVSVPLLRNLTFPGEPPPEDVVVTYASKEDWTKDVAWRALTRIHPQTQDNPWRKAHTLHYWAWYRRAL